MKINQLPSQGLIKYCLQIMFCLAFFPVFTQAQDIYIKTYIHAVKSSDCSIGVTQQTIDRVKQILEEDFAPHNIHFVYSCSNDICDSYYLANPTDLYNSNYSQSNGLNIFLFSGTFLPLGNYGGWQNDPETTSRNCWVRYYTDLERAVSEIVGSSLGLHHTYRGSLYNSTYPGTAENVTRDPNAPCYNATTAGDKVADTNADPGVDDLINNCVWSNNGFDDGCDVPFTGVDPTNIMSLALSGNNIDCRKQFTPGQGARMRNMVQNSAILANALITLPSVITSDITLSSDLDFDSDIRIKSPAKFTITAKLGMAEGKSIIVEPGAQLIVNGGYITVNSGSPCGNGSGYWQGINVMPGTSNSPDNSGRVFIRNNSVIEFANQALFCFTLGNFPGGRVTASDSEFRNNRTAIEFTATQEPSVYTTNSITDCTFRVTSDLPTSYHQQVYLLFCKIFRFSGCTFIDENYIANAPLKTSAIRTFGALVRLSSFCDANPQPFPCPSNLVDKTVINGFYRGVNAENSGGTVFSNIINGTEFTNCYQGIFGKVLGRTNINECVFTIGGYPSQTWEGIMGSNWIAGFNIDNNSFIATGGSDLRTGIYLSETPENPDIISNNQFTNLSRGVNYDFSTFNDNGGTGLQFYCNSHNGNSKDFRIGAPSPTIAMNQGSALSPAGNSFSYSINFFSDFDNNPSNDLLSYFHAANGSQIPVDYLGIVPTQIIDEFTCGSKVKDTRKLVELEADYLVAHQNYDNIRQTYKSTIDGGDTDGLITLINNGTSENAPAIRTTLLNTSPNLSAPVLKAMYNRTDIFTDQTRYNILAANPEMIRSGTLRTYLAESEAALSSTELQALETVAKTVTTTRTALEENLVNAYYEQYYLTQLAFDLLDQEEELDIASTVTWVQRTESFNIELHLATEFLFRYDFSNFNNVLNHISSVYSLSGSEAQDFALCQQMGTTIRAAVQDGRHLLDLSGNEQSTLATIANDNCRFISGIARSILTELYGQTLGECSASELRSNAIRKSVSAPAMNSLSISPNPAQSEILNIGYGDNIPGTGSQLIFTDISGRTVLEVSATPDAQSQTVNISTLQAGIYFISVRNKGLATHRGIVSIVK